MSFAEIFIGHMYPFLFKIGDKIISILEEKKYV
jgi:hypothetical protein